MSLPPCMYCGRSELVWRDDCSQYYCKGCGKFMPQREPPKSHGSIDGFFDTLNSEISGQPVYHCPDPNCRARLEFVDQYQKWYCRRCGKYT